MDNGDRNYMKLHTTAVRLARDGQIATGMVTYLFFLFI